MECVNNVRRSKMKIVAIDPSLTASGYSVYDSVSNTFGTWVFSPKTKGVTRLVEIRDFFKEFMTHQKPDLAVIEGYAYGGRGQDMGEVGGLLRVCCFHDLGIKFIEVVPQHLKRYVCGKGNAQKDLMMMKCLSRWGVEFTDNNKCDAYCLAQFGKELMELGQGPMGLKYGLNFQVKK